MSNKKIASKYTQQNKKSSKDIDSISLSHFHLSTDPIQLTKTLCSCLESKDFDVNSAINIIDQLSNQKLIYSEISNHLFVTSKDNVANILSNIDVLKNQIFNPNNVEYKDIRKIVLKLYDHIQLANYQINVFKLGKDEFDMQLKSSDYINQKIESVNSQVVSLVALFTAMSFLVFGGLSSFESIFSNIQEVSLLKLIILSSVWGFAILNTIAIFMFFTSRVVGKSFKIINHEEDTLFKRYPYIILSNYILLFIFLIASWIYLYVKKFGYHLPQSFVFPDSLIQQNVLLLLILLSFIIILLLILGYIFFIRKRNNIDSTKE